jgi:hypothetical protein
MSRLEGCAVTKLALSILSYGLKLPGGLFVPSLIIGALFGRALGVLVQTLHAAVGDVGIFAVRAPPSPSQPLSSIARLAWCKTRGDGLFSHQGFLDGGGAEMLWSSCAGV